MKRMITLSPNWCTVVALYQAVSMVILRRLNKPENGSQDSTHQKPITSERATFKFKPFREEHTCRQIVHECSPSTFQCHTATPRQFFIFTFIFYKLLKYSLIPLEVGRRIIWRFLPVSTQLQSSMPELENSDFKAWTIWHIMADVVISEKFRTYLLKEHCSEYWDFALSAISLIFFSLSESLCVDNVATLRLGMDFLMQVYLKVGASKQANISGNELLAVMQTLTELHKLPADSNDLGPKYGLAIARPLVEVLKMLQQNHLEKFKSLGLADSVRSFEHEEGPAQSQGPLYEFAALESLSAQAWMLSSDDKRDVLPDDTFNLDMCCFSVASEQIEKHVKSRSVAEQAGPTLQAWIDSLADQSARLPADLIRACDAALDARLLGLHGVSLLAVTRPSLPTGLSLSPPLVELRAALYPLSNSLEASFSTSPRGKLAQASVLVTRTADPTTQDSIDLDRIAALAKRAQAAQSVQLCQQTLRRILSALIEASSDDEDVGSSVVVDKSAPNARFATGSTAARVAATGSGLVRLELSFLWALKRPLLERSLRAEREARASAEAVRSGFATLGKLICESSVLDGKRAEAEAKISQLEQKVAPLRDQSLKLSTELSIQLEREQILLAAGQPAGADALVSSQSRTRELVAKHMELRATLAQQQASVEAVVRMAGGQTPEGLAAEVAQLKNRLALLKADRSTSKAQLNAVEERWSHAHSGLAQSRDRVKALHEELAASERALAELRPTLSQLESQLQNVLSQTQLAQTQAAAYKAETTAVRGQHQKALERLARAHKQANAESLARAETAALIQSVHDSACNLDQAAADVATGTAQLASVTAAADKLRVVVTGQKGHASLLDDRCQALMTQLLPLRAQVVRNHDEIEQLREAKQALEIRRRKLANDIATRRQAVAERASDANLALGQPPPLSSPQKSYAEEARVGKLHGVSGGRRIRPR
jgi:hypothetical protein